MSYSPEPDSHINNKVKVLFYQTCQIILLKRIKRCYRRTPYLAIKRDFITLKAEVNKLDINKLLNVPTSLNILKTRVGRCW